MGRLSISTAARSRVESSLQPHRSADGAEGARPGRLHEAADVFYSQALAELRSQVPGGQLDLERDIWPLFELELSCITDRVRTRQRNSLERRAAMLQAMRSRLISTRS